MIPDAYANVTRTAPDTSSFRLHAHSCWEILYYTKNAGVLRLKNHTPIPFREGTVICVPPYLVHGSTGNDVFENICVQELHFPEELRQAGEAHIADGGCIVFHDTGADLLYLFQMVFRTSINRPVSFTVRIRHLMTCIYDILLEQCHTAYSANPQIAKLANGIMEHFSDPSYRISDSLQAFSCSPGYIRNAFRKQYQMTPVQYLRMIRLKNAVSLLLTSDPSVSIADIAYSSGFADPLYFSKCFRQAYQMSPQAYREEHIQKRPATESEELL